MFKKFIYLLLILLCISGCSNQEGKSIQKKEQTQIDLSKPPPAPYPKRGPIILDENSPLIKGFELREEERKKQLAQREKENGGPIYSEWEEERKKQIAQEEEEYAQRQRGEYPRWWKKIVDSASDSF
jgi:hypothetical protein